jgi:hypothetical protein
MGSGYHIFEDNFKDFSIKQQGNDILHLCYNDLFRKHFDWDILVKSPINGDILYNIIKEHGANEVYVKGRGGDFIVTTKPTMDRLVYEFELDNHHLIWKSSFMGNYELFLDGKRVAKWKTREDFSASHWGSIKIKSNPELAMPILLSGYIISFKLLRKHCF